MPFFDPVKWEYFGCHIKKFALFAAVLAAIVQLYLSVFFLTFHDWWAFISFFVSIISYLVFIISIRKQSWIMLVLFFVYQVLITIVTFAAAIWMMLILMSPQQSWMWNKKCLNLKKGYYLKDCDGSVRKTSGIYFGVFMLFFLINLLCIHVFFYYWKYVKMESRQSGRPAAAARSPAATPYQPAQPPQPPRGQSVPMETVTVSAVNRPTVLPATQNNPYSPGNQFPSQPIQQPIQMPTQNYQYQPTALQPPPPIRNPFPSEADWNAPGAIVPPSRFDDNVYTIAPSAPQISPAYGDQRYPTVRGMPQQHNSYNNYAGDPLTNQPYLGRPAGIPQQPTMDGYPTVRGMPPTSPTSHLYDAPPPYNSDPKY